MKVLLAGGGTAGHINPALAIAGTIKKHQPDAEILFVGNQKGMEARLVGEAGYNFAAIDVRGFRRSLSPGNIVYNIGAARRAVTSSMQAGKIIQSFRPDIAVGTGGYVSGPVLRKAAKMGVPIVVHEQNAYPGVTNRMLSKSAACVMLAVEDAKSRFDAGCHIEVTGNPLRSEILTYNKQKARQELGLGDEPVILSFGGSLGADCINRAVADLLAWSYRRGGITHIHGVGKAGWEWMPKLVESKGVPLKRTKNIMVREYIDDMARCMAAADLVICRCGAITLSELQAQGKASILVPSPYVAENHQYHNAMSLVRRGAAVLIEDKDLTGPKLITQVEKLLEHPETLQEMGTKAKQTAILDASERIYKVILESVPLKK